MCNRFFSVLCMYFFLYIQHLQDFLQNIYTTVQGTPWTIKRNEADFPMKIHRCIISIYYMLYCINVCITVSLLLSSEYEHQTYFFGFLSLPSPNLHCLCYICSLLYYTETVLLTQKHFLSMNPFHPHSIQTTGKFPFHAAIHATQTISLKNYPKKKKKVC